MTACEEKSVAIKDTGFTLLTNPHHPTTDLIFVHGLQGHPEKTWTCTPPRKYSNVPWVKVNKKELPKIFWPLDLLSKHSKLKDTRIMTHGYDSIVMRTFHKSKGHNILHHANELMASLHRERAGDPKRPLIFIAHSLGGIVVKIMLKKSDDQSIYQDLIKSTRGVIFLGTPHRGSTAADWGLLISNLARFTFQKSNDKILKALKVESDILESYRDSFNHLMHKVQLHVYSFYETEKMFNIPGIDRLIVPHESAIIGDVLYETVQSMKKNHSEICKFPDAEDDGYKSVLFAIVQCVEKALENKDTKNKDLDLYISTLELPTPNELGASSEATMNPITISKELDWLFEGPDFREWRSIPSSKLLWLGGDLQSLYMKQAGSLVVKRLREHEERVLYLSCTPSLGFSLKKRPQDLSLRVTRMLICLLNKLEPDSRIVGRVMESFPLSQLTTPPATMGRGFWISNRLFEVLYHALLEVSEPRIYLIIDGLDILRSELYPFISELLHLNERLSSQEDIAIKILFTTQPRLFSPPLSYIEERMETIPYIDEDKERKDCLQSLRTVDFYARPSTIFNADSSTGHWLWEDAAFNQWITPGSSSLLVIEGKPGSGKSTLAKQIIQEKDRLFGSGAYAQKPLIGYFFYSSRGGPTEKSHESMLKAVLWQLLSAEPLLYPIFRKKYRVQRNESGFNFHWKFEDLRDMFESLTTIDVKLLIFIVLDAMDESDRDEGGRGLVDVVDTMQKVCSLTSKCTIKILMTSRPLRELPYVHQFPRLILEEYNRDDIKIIVDEKIEEIVEQLKVESNGSDDDIYDNEFDDIKEYIKQHADGVFLWVDLVLKKIKVLAEAGFNNIELMRPQNFLPLELNGLYKQIIDHLSKNSKNDIAEGRRFISIAMFALRRLTLSEVKDAIIIPSAIESDTFAIPKDIDKHRVRLLRNRITARCGDLLEIKPPFVQLVHESVRDFLRREAAGPFIMNDQDGNDEMLSICARYLRISLTRDTVSDSSTKSWTEQDYAEFLKLINDRPFLNYVISFLPSHLKLARILSVVKEWQLYKDEMRSLEPAYFLLRSLFNEDQLLEEKARILEAFRTKALVVAAKRDYYEAIKSLLAAGAKLNCVDDTTGASPLSAAVAEGRLKTTKLLIDLGSKVNHRDRFGETPLHKAAVSGSEEIAQQLLNAGALVHENNLNSETPLHLAAACGHEHVVALLVKNKATTYEKDRYGRTALHRAVGIGHYGIVTRLIDAGARGIGKDKIQAMRVRVLGIGNAPYIGTPLHIAVDKKDVKMVQLLVEKGASVNSFVKDSIRIYGGTALHSAATAGDKDIVTILLNNGGENVLRTKDRYGLCPADCARENGHMEIEQMLLPKEESDDEECEYEYESEA